ncbi:MAG: translation initiation factor IF-2 subunit beta [Nanoarchaeota archaeon]|nr:translation initiation factor IF-2 subunit beta [Nanoarchaeota archaeon]
MDYMELLKQAREKLPESVLKIERFNIPKIRGHIQGNKTILSNFFQITDTLRRDPNDVLKFILKELATPGEIKKTFVIIGSKVSASRINDKIELYADKFVVCKECSRPDTKIVKHDKIFQVKCSACGAKYPVNA